MKLKKKKFRKLIREKVEQFLTSEDVETDEYYRGLAEDFFDSLYDYFEGNIEEIAELHPDDNGAKRTIMSREISAGENFEDLFVYLIEWSDQPRLVNRVANWYLHLPILYDLTNDGEFLLRKLKDRRGVIVHEVIHYLDYKNRGVGLKRAPSTSDKKEEYFNHPTEFNAYYQEGISNIAKFLDFAGIDYLKDEQKKSFKEFKEFVLDERDFFNQNFIRNINKKRYRRLIKRLYQWFKQNVKTQ